MEGNLCIGCLHAAHWRECQSEGCYCQLRGPSGSEFARWKHADDCFIYNQGDDPCTCGLNHYYALLAAERGANKNLAAQLKQAYKLAGEMAQLAVSKLNGEFGEQILIQLPDNRPAVKVRFELVGETIVGYPVPPVESAVWKHDTNVNEWEVKP